MRQSVHAGWSRRDVVIRDRMAARVGCIRAINRSDGTARGSQRSDTTSLVMLTNERRACRCTAFNRVSTLSRTAVARQARAGRQSKRQETDMETNGNAACARRTTGRETGSGTERLLRRLAIAIGWLCAVMLGWPLVPSAASAASSGGLANLPAVMPAMSCQAIASLDLSGVTDGPVTITSATVLPAGTVVGNNTLAAPMCDVKGTIGPGASLFELQLPTQGWTQRYLQTGCGGLCGNLSVNAPMASTCVPVTNGTIAMAATDMGHEGGNDGAWALDPRAKLDFAYRAEHATAQVAKAIIQRFYARPARYAYFDGCSDGGREALMEAQRYPDDFDGIAAGAPANDLIVQNTFHHAWPAAVNTDPKTGNAILLAGKLPMLHAAVLKACDALDGVVDGVIDNPRACRFDPATLVCATGQADATCLTPQEATVVRRLHDGATTADGLRLEPFVSREWGSELNWTLFVPATATAQSGTIGFVLPFLRYLDYYNASYPSATIGDLKFTLAGFLKTVVPVSNYLAATDPDLSRFAGRNGKLLLWHGLEDQHISPRSSIEYYEAMKRYMGDANVERFARFYLFPGVAHCGGGQGPNVFDVLTPLMAWTETGTTPGRIVASIVDASGNTTRTRPVFPYPATSRYTGSGSTDDAANFVADTPKADPFVDLHWAGEWLYSPGYEATCRVNGSQLACTGGNGWRAYRP
ncbi:tannase/feruloyl esterase family alpha/beta hydrolase [Burkholderia multivorans]|nr:tannase/feruloyl esterase family alpha/beta hydrolase [Burkholderia multivorans]MBU9459124.1 tannase/feruloyl esterase family alpha/beta hydrolase [Burkholderia multivorans]MBU9522664.1 tannase/feruloyl esterase family alpha/beta hydrolase [Burkholderia multivorans]MBU9529429.1 tannase/feruloyl esterase family alpha/beta hydrolase [Burkholderia multivorans]MBU9567007.1 tannase/feruloyl esterase family alpha/beta hydrolase [Burkholderia multivorans]